MDISLTVFKPPRWWAEKETYVYDNKTHRRMDFSSFDELEKLFYNLSKQPKAGKKDAELISPAIYEQGTTRANKNVVSWAGWCAVDIDDVTIEGKINDYVRNLVPDWRFVCYSTASSKLEKPKFRLVLPLDRHVQVGEIKHFWFALQSYLDDAGDKQCKDLSRMYYIPAEYADAYNFIFSGSGTPIAVDALLAKYPYVENTTSRNFLDRLPESMQKSIIEYRKTQMDNNSFSWTSYRDCPFVSKKLINEYSAIASIDNSGRYAMIYKIMTSIALSAVKRSYPITAFEVEQLVRELDQDTSRKYENRPLHIEADRAIEYAYRKA